MPLELPFQYKAEEIIEWTLETFDKGGRPSVFPVVLDLRPRVLRRGIVNHPLKCIHRFVMFLRGDP